MNNSVTKYSCEWDYSINAAYYKYRPNYSFELVDILVSAVQARFGVSARVADIGAGTGNLTRLLASRGLTVTAIEPNEIMRGIGMIDPAIRGNIEWVDACGEDTRLPNESVHWVTFGSSFNVIDRAVALKECLRILVRGGGVSCLWNHRNLEDKNQQYAEAVIKTIIPNYTHGIRREDQSEFLSGYGNVFSKVVYLKSEFLVERTIDEYIDAWRSVKNKYWDLQTKQGSVLFSKIEEKLRECLPSNFSVKYSTVAWTMFKK